MAWLLTRPPHNDNGKNMQSALLTIRDADISTTEVYARADNEAKRAALEKASLCLELPCASNWEQDADLIAWLSSLG